jgi:zinc/manganese transport system permease protein
VTGASWSSFLDLEATWSLLQRDFVLYGVGALALIGLLGGLLGPTVVSRQMSFAVHGTSELTFTGAAAALLAGISVNTGALAGAVVAAIVFGLLGNRARERDSVIGVVLAFGLGLGLFFVFLYGRVGAGFALLAGQVVAVGSDGLRDVLVTTVVVLIVLAVIYRPLQFASTDPEVAEALGVRTRLLSVVFAVILGAAVAQAVQIIGALLVMSLLITPAAAASRITSRPVMVVALSVVFAEIAALGGMVLSLAPNLPASVLVTSISFAIYVICRLVGRRRLSRTAVTSRRRVEESATV